MNTSKLEKTRKRLQFASTSVHGLKCIFVLCLLLGWTQALAAPGIVAAHTKNGVFVSPDRRYSVKYEMGDASDPDQLLLYSLGNNHQDAHRSLWSIGGWYKINGLVWVPKHAHTLIVSVKYDEDKPVILAWNGKTPHLVLRGKLKRGEDTDLEALTLVGASQDGKLIFYKDSYYPDVKKLGYRRSNRIKQFPLPPGLS